MRRVTLRRVAHRRTIPLLVAGICAAAPISGCGGSDDDTRGYSAPPRYSTDQVITAFRTDGEVTLLRDNNYSNESWDVLNTDDSVPASAHYGAMTIYVVKDGESGSTLLKSDGRYSPKSGLIEGKGKRLEPDVNGIYWDQSFPEPGGPKFEPYWSATKRYGANVYLVWIGGETQGTDQTFDRADSVLRGLSATRQGG